MHEGKDNDSRFPGLQKYFNSYTLRGRANWAKLCLSMYVGAFVLWKMSRKKKPPKDPETLQYELNNTNELPSSLSLEDTVLPRVSHDDVNQKSDNND